MIFYILFIGIFLLFTTGEILRFNLGNNIYLKPLDAFVVLSALIFWVFYFLNRIKFSKEAIIRPIINFVAIAFLSLLINYNGLEHKELLSAFLYWLRFVSFVTVYFLILSIDKKYVKKIPIFIFVSGIVILVLGLIQYFLYPNLQNLYYLGWDEHTYRLFTVFLDPNFAGSVISLFLFFILGLFRYFQRESRKNYLLILGCIAFLTSVAIFLTFSRSAILMFTTGVFTFLVLIKKKKFSVFLIAFVAFLILLTLPGINRESTNLFRTTSTFARINSYENAIKIIKDKPIIGVGFNAYRSAQKNRGFFDNLDRYPKNSGAGVDSSLLFVAATTGIIGLSAYLYLWYAVLKRASFLYQKSENIFALILICSASGLFVNSLFINSLFYPSIILWIFVMMAMMERKNAIQH